VTLGVLLAACGLAASRILDGSQPRSALLTSQPSGE
jgi:hypothetical protein